MVRLEEDNIKKNIDEVMIRDNNYKSNIISKIIILEEEYYRLYKLNLKSLELFGRNIKIDKQIKKINKQLKTLKNLLFSLNESSNIINKKRGIVPLSKKQIISLDYKYKVDSYRLFILLELENDQNKRLKIMHKLRDIYINLSNKVNKDDYKSKSQIKDILLYLRREIEQEKIKNNSIHKKEVKKISIKRFSTIDNQNENIIDEPIYYSILNGQSISMYTISDVIEAFCEVVRKYEINKNLITITNEIIDRLNLESKYETALDYLYAMIDSSKIRKYGFNKDDEEFQILKKVSKTLKEYKDRIKLLNAETFDDESYRFDLISNLLYDENNYLLIKKILNRCKTIINSKKKGKHIIVHILELYLENYKMLLNKDTEKYVNIDFLKEVYYLFTKNSYLYLDEDTKKIINTKIYNFIVSLTNDKSKEEFQLDGEIIKPIFVKSDKRRKNIIEEVKQLSTHYYYNSQKYDLKRVNECQLENQIRYICDNNHISNVTDEIDLTDEESIVLDNKYIAYNYKSTEDSNILRISVCDIAAIVPDDSSLNSYIYNQMIMKNPLDQRILDKFKFQNAEESSAITFKISLDKNNKPISLYIYKSRIKPKYINVNNQMYNDILKVINDVSNRKKYEFDIPNSEKIYEVSRRLLNELYLDIAQNKNIPFTYSGVEKLSDIEPNIYSVVGSISSKLPKEEFTSIYNIIINNLGEFHYSDEVFDVDGEFDLNLIGEPSYILLENQRLIKSLLINELCLKPEQYDRRKRIYNIEHQNMIIDLNNALNYKNVSDFEYTKRKRKKKILSTYLY